MSSMATAPLSSLDPGTSGAAPPTLGAPTTVVPSNMQLPRNPQLPQHPLGAYTDSIYEAALAQLQNQISKQYADILQQLGYMDDQGNFVQGSVEANARKSEADLRRQADLATEDVTKQHQQLGTLFSGLRGTDQARATEPIVNQIGQIETDTPLTLAQLYEKASGLTNDYVLGQNQLIADAASRAAAAQLGNPAGGAPPLSGYGPSGTSGLAPDGTYIGDAAYSAQFPQDNPDSLGAMAGAPINPSPAPAPAPAPAPSLTPTPYHDTSALAAPAPRALATAKFGFPNLSQQALAAAQAYLNPQNTSGIASGQGHVAGPMVTGNSYRPGLQI